MKRPTLPPMTAAAKRRTGIGACLLAVLGALSQVPWDAVASFARRFVAPEPAAAPPPDPS